MFFSQYLKFFSLHVLDHLIRRHISDVLRKNVRWTEMISRGEREREKNRIKNVSVIAALRFALM